MVAQCAPCSIFSVEQLVVAFQFVAVVLNLAAIGAAPVLHHVPVGALAAVAGGDEAHGSAGGVHLPDDVGTFLGKLFGQRAFVLQSPQDDGGRVAAFLHPLYKVTLETFLELWGVIPYMGRELRPPEQTLAVDELLIFQIVRLVGIPEGVEACLLDLFDSCLDLLVAECVALSEQVLVFAHAVDECRLAVQEETLVAIVAGERP